MEKKKKRAVLLSWMLIFTMVLGLFQGLSFVSEAAEEEKSYTEYTFLDFGIKDGTYSNTQVKSNAFSSFDGVAFSGKIKLQAGSDNSGIVFTPDTNSYTGTSLMFRSSPEMTLYLISKYGKSGETEYLSWDYKDLGFSSKEEMYAQPFEVRFSFDKTDTGYTVNVTVNGVTRTGNCTHEMANAKHFVLWAGKTVDVASDYPAYTEYTFSDFGFADGAYSSNSCASSVMNGYDKVTFSGKLRSEGQAAQRGFVFTSDQKDFNTALRVFEDNAGNIWLWNHFNPQNTSKYVHHGIGYDKIGYSSKEDMYNSDVSVRLHFDKEGDEYRVRMTLNEQYVYQTYCPASLDNAKYFAVQAAESTLNLTSCAKEYTEYTFSDLGIADGTYTSAKQVNNVFGEYNGIAFTGKVKFTAGSKLSFASGKGINLLDKGEAGQWLENVSNTSLTCGISIPKDDKGYTKVRVRFDKTANGYREIITLNDTTTYMTYTTKEMEESMGFLVEAIEVQSVETGMSYTEHTLEELGLQTGDYTTTELKQDVLPVKDKHAIVGTIAFSKGTQNANTGLVLTNDANTFNVLNVLQADSEGNIWLENGTRDNASIGIGYKDLGFASADAFFGSPISIRMRFDKMDTLYRILVTLNDTTFATYCPIETFEQVRHVGARGTSDKQFTICDENDTGYTEYTFSSVGLEDGKYTSTQYGALDITTYDKLSFTGNVTFSNGGQYYGFGFVPEKDHNGLVLGIVNSDCIYLTNNFSSDGKYIPLKNLGLDKDTIATTKLKVNVKFDKADATNYNVTVTVNDTCSITTTATISGLETCTRIAVLASETYPFTIESVGMPTTPDTPVEPAGPIEASFNSFGMEGKKIISQDVSSTKVPNDAKTLDKVKFTGYVSFVSNSQADYIVYGANGDGKGIKFFWDQGNFWFYDTTEKKVNSCFAGIGMDKIGVTSATDEVKVQIETTYTDTGVTVKLAVGNWNGEYEVPGYHEVLGTGILIHSVTGAVSYRSSLGEEIDVNTKLETQGYKRITPADFKGLGYGKYVASESGFPTGTYEDATTLDMTYLDTNIQYNFTDETDTNQTYFAYGFENDWTAPQILYTNKDKVFGYGYTTLNFYPTPAQFGMQTYSEIFNIKIAMKIASDNKNYEIRIWVNDIELPAGTTTGNVIGNKMAVYTPETSSITFIAPEVKEIQQDPTSYNLRKYDHTTAQNYFVSGDATVTQNGKDVEVVDNQLDKPGDYVITTEVTRSAERYIQNVALYILGDVDLNGTAGAGADVIALEDMLKTSSRIIPETAAEYAADIDNNGVVDKNDLKLLIDVKDNADSLVTLLKKYYVPAKSYDYLGGNDVMPIAGYFGPYTSSEKDYLTEDIFQKIKDSGVNMVNHTDNDAGGDASYTKKALALADQYGLGWFVDDYSLNDHQLAGTLTDQTLSAELGKYSYFESFLGIHIVDEPGYDKKGAYEAQPLENYTALSKMLNSYTNVTGFVNMAAEDIFETKYESLWNKYLADGVPQLLSSDDYPINNGEKENATKATGYFRTLGMTRKKANENNLPFWSYVQAGGYFDRDVNKTDEETKYIATEAETYWNVNTALAFGAKGIVWFPLIQPTSFDGTDASNPVDRSGVILSNGEESSRYAWVQNANKQIAAVDDVLMKATSTAIVATRDTSGMFEKDSYAKSQAAGNISTIGGTDTTTVKTSHSKLTAVSTDRQEYGALVGCFNYRDTEAFYVVNYDVTAQAEITLTFDQAYHVRVVQNGESKCGNMTGATMTLTIGAGQGALVVLENTADAQCYYKTVKASDGTISYQCDHTVGNAGGVLFGEAICYGDLNGNGKVDAADIVRMKKAMAEETTTNYPGMGDLNGDYKIESVDCDLFREYIVGETKNIIALLNKEGQI